MTRKIDRARDALRALDRAASPQDLHEVAHRLRDAVVDAAAAITEARAALERWEAVLAIERRERATAERRERLAREVMDSEAEQIAARRATKHGEHVARLEREAAAARAVVAAAQRELADLRAELLRAEDGRPRTPAERSAERAWRALRAGGSRPRRHPGPVEQDGPSDGGDRKRG
jgi:hypothetical protein